MGKDLVALIARKGLITGAEAASHVAGEPIRGSWWAHPAGGRIYNALQALAEHPDTASFKLVEGKQTFVHRRLWPALARAQAERALWPAPSPEARRLLARVRRTGALVASGKARLELERVLLVVGREVHTAGGAHATELVPFERWVPRDVARRAARMEIEDALAELAGAGFAIR